MPRGEGEFETRFDALMPGLVRVEGGGGDDACDHAILQHLTLYVGAVKADVPGCDADAATGADFGGPRLARRRA